jgi:N-methylhydantoinase A
MFEVDDIDSDIEIMQWYARISCKMSNTNLTINKGKSKFNKKNSEFRNVFFKKLGSLKTKVLNYENLKVGKTLIGPAIIEAPFTTVLIDPKVKFKLNNFNNLEINLKYNKKETQIDEGSSLLW